MELAKERQSSKLAKEEAAAAATRAAKVAAATVEPEALPAHELAQVKLWIAGLESKGRVRGALGRLSKLWDHSEEAGGCYCLRVL